jgi:hypothetical protein
MGSIGVFFVVERGQCRKGYRILTTLNGKMETVGDGWGVPFLVGAF